MPLSFDELRAELGMPYSDGSWFALAEGIIQFAPQYEPSVLRPTILSRWANDVGQRVYPRSTKMYGRGLYHGPHVGIADHPSACGLTREGMIVMKPITVPSSACSQASYRCTEPDASIVAAVRRGRLP